MWFQGALLDAPAQRRELGAGAWIDVCPGWLPDADDLFGQLREHVAWRAEQRQMYDRMVDVPRLVASYGSGDELPDQRVVEARDALNVLYAPVDPFATAGLCLYRDGNDSVAWHGDRIGRGRSEDVLVAIISLGAPRRLSLRPRGGGEATHIGMGHGDLLVMGGTCQRTHDHAVLKTSKSVGPRISVQFRPRGVL